MKLIRKLEPEISTELLDSILALPLAREVTHCGVTFSLSPFEYYATCPTCGVRIKVRSMSGCGEIEDVFDAVFAWMNQAGADELVRARQKVIADDSD